MRINHKVLSIPPFISTSWKNISSLQSEQNEDKNSLIINLQDASTVTIPDLEPVIIEAIFAAHAKHLEAGNKAPVDIAPKKPVQDVDSSFKFFEFENVNAMLYHNEQERNSPDLPSYVLDKVQQISQEMGLSNSATLPVPEPHCNCPYCQIAKSVQESTDKQDHIHEEEEEDVTAEDLSFTSWIIRPIRPNFYQVAHPDHPKEDFQVSLESPIGCTCGSNQCEHIRAVLSS